MYSGLDIVTNKINDFQGIEHHLLGFQDPKNIITVQDFKAKAIEIIKDIIGRNKTPIIVGGTNYYIESLIWNDYLFTQKLISSIHIPEEDLYKELEKVDPEMAGKLHPNATRKIKRSLEIFYTYGQKHSQLIEQQNLQNLVFQNYKIHLIEVELEKLDPKLNARVDKMILSGMQKEICDFFNKYGIRSKGIFQAIGFKEFKEYFNTKKEEDFLLGIEKMKQATRQYARRQKKWIRNHLENRIQKTNSQNIIKEVITKKY